MVRHHSGAQETMDCYDAAIMDRSSDFSTAEPAEPRARLRGPRRPDLIRDELLADIFAASVARKPDAVAICWGDRVLTYAEVDERASSLARGLIRRGIGPGSVVGLWMPRGADILIAQVAVAKTGAAWLPFDAEAPVDRIDVCLRDADAQLLLTDDGLASKITTATGLRGCKLRQRGRFGRWRGRRRSGTSAQRPITPPT